MPHPVTIYRGLLTSFLVVVVILGGAILGVSILGERQAIETLSESFIHKTASEAEVRLSGFFAPTQRGLLITGAWGEAGLLPIERPDEINALLMAYMREFTQISSVLVADSRGRENMLLRLGNSWRNRRTRVDQWGDRSEWAEWQNGAVPSIEWRDLGYDPRLRPWYKGAISAAGEIHWTPPYTFFTTKDPGITASVTFDNGDGITRVVGFDLLLRDISVFTIGMGAGPLGKVFVMTDDDRIVGLPNHPRFDDGQVRKAALLSSPAELDLPLVTDTLQALGSSRSAASAVRFSSEGDSWWGGSRRFPLGPDRHLNLVVAVSEDLLLREVRQVRVWIIVATLIVIGFSLWRAAVLARRFSRPIESLVRESERIGQGDLDQAECIETDLAEVRRLTRAHDRMRGALRTLLKLERDLQIARRIQQSTFPDNVARLSGFQMAAWSEPAEETGGDTYDLVGIRRAETGDIILADEQPEHVLLLLADAVGHGVGPALSVTQVRAMLRMAVRSGLGLEAIARHLNEQLCEDLSEGRFVTVWLAELSAAEGTIRSFSAGQGPLLHYVAGMNRVEVLKPQTVPFGLFEDIEIQVPTPVALAPGDLFAAISDGIFEARNDQRELFGTARVVEILERHHSATPDVILDHLKRALANFTAGKPADDDCTVVLVKRV